MQEEVTNKTVTLIVDGAKLTEQTFEKAVKKFLEEIQKSKQPKIYRGKQTLKQLAGQNAGLANIEISELPSQSMVRLRILKTEANFTASFYICFPRLRNVLRVQSRINMFIGVVGSLVYQKVSTFVRFNFSLWGTLRLATGAGQHFPAKYMRQIQSKKPSRRGTRRDSCCL